MGPSDPSPASLYTTSAPYAEISALRSALTLLGITSFTRNPLAAATIAYAMPVLPEVESMIVLSGVSAPRRSPSSIMNRAARSFTEAPGLKHSAFAYTSMRGNCFSNIRTRSSGVLPISCVIPSIPVRWAIFKRIESLSAREVDQYGPADHEYRRDRVADQRAPIHAPAFQSEDVQHRLADQVAGAEQRENRGFRHDSEEHDGGGNQHLEQLQSRVGSHQVSVGQRLREVGDDVAGVLDPDRQPHRPRGNTQLGSLVRRPRAVRGDLRGGGRGIDTCAAC